MAQVVWRIITGQVPESGHRGPMVAAGIFLVPVWLLCVLGVAPRPAGGDERSDSIVTLLELVLDADEDSARECLAVLAEQVQSGELKGERLGQLKPRLEQLLKEPLRDDSEHPLRFEASVLAAGWGHRAAVSRMRCVLIDPDQADERRLAAAKSLVASRDPQLLSALGPVLGRPQGNPLELRSELLAALGSLEDPAVAEVVLKHYADLDPPLRPRAIELLLQRGTWSKTLLRAIRDGGVPAEALHQNQVVRLLASRDSELVELVRGTWGTVRTQRDPRREAVLQQMRDFLRTASGSPHRGRLVFDRVCGQCHRIHGQGQQVGPDITSNGRGTFDQLLSNVFDPSLVIGSAYQPRTVITAEGRVLTGLLIEESPQRLVLKLQGGKQEVIPRDDVDELRISPLSLMPEGLENQLQPRELADLFAFLALDGPPDAANSQPISGTPQGLIAPSPEDAPKDSKE